MEEIVLRGPESDTDVRVVNSYPSKVKLHSFNVKLYSFDVKLHSFDVKLYFLM